MYPSHSSQDIPGLDGPDYLAVVPGLDGPDYLAVVIEWNDDVPTLVRSRTPSRTSTMRHKTMRHKIIAVLGVLGAIMSATWAIRHLRAAS